MRKKNKKKINDLYVAITLSSLATATLMKRLERLEDEFLNLWEDVDAYKNARRKDLALEKKMDEFDASLNTGSPLFKGCQGKDCWCRR